jgi:hypothetical protein
VHHEKPGKRSKKWAPAQVRVRAPAQAQWALAQVRVQAPVQAQAKAQPLDHPNE